MNSTSLYIEISPGHAQVAEWNRAVRMLPRPPSERTFDGRVQTKTDGQFTGFSQEKELAATVESLVRHQRPGRFAPSVEAAGVIERGIATGSPFANRKRISTASRATRLGWQQLPRAGTGQQEIVVVAVKKEVVKDYSEVLSTCGINAIFVVAALARNAVCSAAPESYAVLDMGSDHAELISFAQGAATSIRVLPWGGGKVDEQSSAIESLVACMNPQWIGQKLFLTGNSARQKEIASQLAKQLGRGVEIQTIPIPEESVSAAILGLKKEGNDSTHLPLILQFDESAKGESITRSAPGKWVALAVVFMLTLLFLPYAEALFLQKRFTAIPSKLYAKPLILLTIVDVTV